ncbi:non-canonical purine NTP pyrophosphatase [Tumebacillus algifaecis]|uniref:dITP/XTP pyrophosphatase n=1 Tax=Tumebacillus algifaecis TaxID=1214604 RepID=A0A223D0N7_9BACL|nr:XTP/dITP diphosphatase [Tumebacillus algifaecis]ASS74896.1 non-canonical purine NTP pyrophosphatase [Tumebacillus algifaecis]
MEQIQTKLLLATKNQGKVKEIQHFFAELGWHVEAVPQTAPDVTEDQETFAGNAIKKAEEMARAFHMPALADDSGLEVDALQGRPGVYSARYAGEHASDQQNNEKLCAELASISDGERTARFVSAIALARPGQETLVAFGTLEGYILTEGRGTGGFGYDPLFLLPERDKTLAELTIEEKNGISHRAKALTSMIEMLKMEDRQS